MCGQLLRLFQQPWQVLLKITSHKKLVLSFAGIVIAILLLLLPDITFPPLDRTADNYFKEGITRAGITYATCRVINGSLSIIKESSLQLEPAGVGVSLAVGQILDPIDDMTERLSDVLVTAITSLGVQKLIYEISISFAPPLLGGLLMFCSLLMWFEHSHLQRLQRTALKLALLILIGRCCLPFASMANEILNEHFFNKQIVKATQELEIVSGDLGKLKDFSLPETQGILGTIENSTSFIKQKSAEFKSALLSTASNMAEIVENLLTLTFLYVGIFIIQVILLPLLSFFLLMKLANILLEETPPF